MSGWRVFLTVVLVLVVIGLLVGGGFALYRLGYAQGFATAASAAGENQLPRLYGRGMMGFDDGRVPVWPYGGMMLYGGHMPFGMMSFGGWFGWIFYILLLAGVVTLIVLGVRALALKRPEEIHAAPAAPAFVEPSAAKPTRGAKRS